MKVIPVLLAGGIGERFWPLSRSSMPKQLHSLSGNKSMLEETLQRVKPLCSKGVRPVMVTSAKIAEKIKNTLPANSNLEIIEEPQGKNTAPAIALAAAWIRDNYGDAVMLIVSADHAISPKSKFLKTARYAISLSAASEHLIIFGIKPLRPETGYGYIELGEIIDKSDIAQTFRAKRFVEKPSGATAKRFMNSGNYLWNSGMFVWRSSVIIKQFKEFMPQLHAQMETLSEKEFSPRAIEQFYSVCCKESIDYGVMEHSGDVAVVAGDFQWDDIGSWESMSRIKGRDSRNNTVTGKNVFEKESSNSLIVNKSEKSLVTIGAKNMAVIVVDDAVLVIDRSKLPQLKTYLEEIRAKKALPDNLF